MTNRELRHSIEDEIPFTLYLADGRSFDVPHRDFIFLPPRSTSAIIAEYDEENGETVTHRIPLLMISGIESRSETESV